MPRVDLDAFVNRRLGCTCAASLGDVAHDVCEAAGADSSQAAWSIDKNSHFLDGLVTYRDLLHWQRGVLRTLLGIIDGALRQKPKGRTQ